MQLEYTPDAVRLVVLDDGQPSDPALIEQSGGFGLTGLRERLNQLGGSLYSGPGREGGFEVEVCIPFEGGHR